MPRKTSLKLADIRFQGGAPFRTAREQKEVLSLIRQLAVSAGIGVADLALSAAILEALSGGRSKAHVFKLTPFFGPDRQVKGPPVVVKIAPRTQGEREKANYDKFVRWALPAACRPELLGFASTPAHAGLCYSFAGRPDGARMDTLTECLQRGDATRPELVLRTLFDPLRDTWYNPALLRTESDLARRYLDRYFKGPGPAARKAEAAETETSLQACAKRYFKARQKDGRYVIGRLSFPSPHATLFASGQKRRYHSCILHGDLNSDNILVADVPSVAKIANASSSATGVTMIDFQKTGRGHVHEDLVAVEASIRINYGRDVSRMVSQDALFSEILKKERLIALGRPPRNDPYPASIRKVRDAASRYFGGIEDNANYHFAVAAIGLRLMQAVDLSHVARARITASTLWAAKSLAGEKL